jgi:hypothetical protein
MITIEVFIHDKLYIHRLCDKIIEYVKEGVIYLEFDIFSSHYKYCGKRLVYRITETTDK